MQTKQFLLLFYIFFFLTFYKWRSVSAWINPQASDLWTVQQVELTSKLESDLQDTVD